MRVPVLPYSSGIRKLQQLAFSGYQHTAYSGEGQIYDEENISARQYPFLRPIRERAALPQEMDNGIFAHDELGWVNGSSLYYDGRLIGTVANSRKQFAVMGDRIVIWPDKVVLNAKYKVLGEFSSLQALEAGALNPREFDAYAVGSTRPKEIYVWNGSKWVSNGKELQAMENTVSAANVKFKSGTYHGVSAKANTMEFTTSAEGLGFKVGDGVTISGCTVHPENNKTAIIREIEGKQLRFYEYAFTLGGSEGLTDYTETGTITIARTVPDMDVICAVDNRLFGAKDDTLYASKLGDPTNFNVFDGLTSDSWFQDTGTAGSFSGCISYLGYPMFFKPDRIFKIYGKNAENFEPSGSATMGVKAGAWRSLAVAGEILYYLSDSGLMAYAGGMPESAAEPFGNVKYTDAAAGSDGRRLYLCMEQEDGKMDLFCLDTENGILHREEELYVYSFCRHNGKLYGLMAGGGAVEVNGDAGDARDAWVEFGDITEQTMDRKGVSRLQMRVLLEQQAELTVWIQYDSSGQWLPVKTLEATRRQSFSFPVMVRRCDHYRIKLVGRGYWELQAMAREFYVGSGVH